MVFDKRLLVLTVTLFIVHIVASAPLDGILDDDDTTQTIGDPDQLDQATNDDAIQTGDVDGLSQSDDGLVDDPNQQTRNRGEDFFEAELAEGGGLVNDEQNRLDEPETNTFQGEDPINNEALTNADAEEGLGNDKLDNYNDNAERSEIDSYNDDGAGVNGGFGDGTLNDEAINGDVGNDDTFGGSVPPPRNDNDLFGDGTLNEIRDEETINRDGGNDDTLGGYVPPPVDNNELYDNQEALQDETFEPIREREPTDDNFDNVNADDEYLPPTGDVDNQADVLENFDENQNAERAGWLKGNQGDEGIGIQNEESDFGGNQLDGYDEQYNDDGGQV